MHDQQNIKIIKFGTLRWTGHVMRLEESDAAQKFVCTKPGRNGDVGEADQSRGGAKRYRRTAQGFDAEIGEVAEAH